jgi:hypothetical protein
MARSAAQPLTTSSTAAASDRDGSRGDVRLFRANKAAFSSNGPTVSGGTSTVLFSRTLL